MRHRVAHRKLGRVTEHRISMLRNQAHALLLHERIETTVARAKELRPFVERIITIAKRGVTAGDGNGRVLHARRLVLRDIPDQDVVRKLFDTLAPRFASREGGYTRMLRVGWRRGDNAEVAQVELIGSEFNPKAAAEKGKAKAAATRSGGVGGRLRAAAERLRGKKAASSDTEAPAHEATKPAKRAGKTGTRKTGGSNRGK